MKPTHLFLILIGLLFVACTPTQEATVPQPTQQPPTAVTEEAPVCFSLEELLNYQRTTYYLRPGENFEAVVTLLLDTAKVPVCREQVVEALAKMNNVYKTQEGLYSFTDTSLLAPVEIPYLQGFPSFSELGITTPHQVTRTHTVQEGETLTSISQLYGFWSYLDFAAVCGIESPDNHILRVGDTLVWLETIPAQYAAPEEVSSKP